MTKTVTKKKASWGGIAEGIERSGEPAQPPSRALALKRWLEPILIEGDGNRYDVSIKKVRFFVHEAPRVDPPQVLV